MFPIVLLALVTVGLSVVAVVVGVRQGIRLRWKSPFALAPVIVGWWLALNLASIGIFLLDAYMNYPDPTTSVPWAWFPIVIVAQVSLIAPLAVVLLMTLIFGTRWLVSSLRDRTERSSARSSD
jgi:hypothetical protein